MCTCMMAALPRLELAAVDVVIAHAQSAKSYTAQADKTAGWTAARAEQTRFRKDVPDHAAFRFVPFSAKTCVYVHIVCRIPKGSYKRVKVRSHTVEECMLIVTKE